MSSLARRYPDLTELYSIGRSFEGGDHPEPGGRKTVAHLAGSNPFLTQVTARWVTVTWIVSAHTLCG